METDQVEDVACGKNFTLILTAQKTIFACGSGRWGVLGNGKVSMQHIPTRITEGIPRIVHAEFCVTKIACGWSHCLAVAHGKGVYMWGQPYYDCDDNQPMIPIPQLVLDLNGSSQVTSLSCGQNHSAALVRDPMNHSKLFTWGSNAFSQLGYSTASFPDPSLSLIPRVVEVLSECDVVEVTCGWNYTAALVSEGRVIGWGGNKYYQFGEDKFEERPEYLNLPKVDAIVSGYSYIFMLTREIESEDLSSDRELVRMKNGSIDELYVDNSLASKMLALSKLDPH
jgi:alpha-tubulin suppressor-like RCC1 family protein